MFFVGDLAAAKQKEGSFVRGVAQGGFPGGEHAAKSIVRLIEGKPTLPFKYRDKGSLATIGRAAAVADFGWLKLSGFVAWAFWLVVHIFFLIGFRNRLLVFMQWAWAYVTYERGARLITGRDDPILKP